MSLDLDRRRFLGLAGALGAGAVSAGPSMVAGQPAPGEPVPALSVYVPNWPDQIEIWRQLARTWRELGVVVDVQQGDMSVWRTQIAGQHRTPHLVSMDYGSTPDRLDPDYFLSVLHSRASAPGGLNYGHFRDARYDELVDAQRGEPDEAKRQELVRAAQARAAELDPSFILFFRDYISAYNSERWADVVPTLGSGFFYLPWGFMRMKPKTSREIARATFPYDFDTMNPFTALGVTNHNIVRYMYPPLTYFDPDGQVDSLGGRILARVDPTTVDIVVRSGMKWDDGRPLTGDDVKFTFDLIMEKKFAGLRILSEVIDTVRADRTDGHPLQAEATLCALHLEPAERRLRGAQAHLGQHFRSGERAQTPSRWGAGAFKLAEWRKGEFLRFETNPHFFVKPNIKALFLLIVPSFENQMNMLEQGASDVLAYSIDSKQGERLAKNKSLSVVSTPSVGFHEVRINCELPPLDDPVVRKALQYAIDREGLLGTIFGGAGVLARNSFITPSQKEWSNGAIPEFKFDLATARKMLADAGYSWGPDGRLRMPKKS